MRVKFTRYLELVFYRTYADLRSEIVQTYLGILWWIIEPITTMAIYYFVFHTIFAVSTEDFIPFLLIGIVVWRWFASTVQVGSAAIVRNRSLVQQAPIHPMVYPTVEFLENSVKFLASLVVLLAFLWFYGFGIQVHYLALPLILLAEALIIFGAMLPLAAIVPFVPDITSAIPHVLRIFFYASAVLYTPSRIPDRWRWIIDYNPMALVIDAARDVLMYNRWPVLWLNLLGAAAASGLAALAGAMLIHRFGDVYGKRIIE